MLYDTLAGAPLSARRDAGSLCCVSLYSPTPKIVTQPGFLPPPPISVCAELQSSSGFLTFFQRVCIQMMDRGVLPEGLSFKDICYRAAEPYDGSESTADILTASNVAQRSATEKGLDLISLSCHHLHLPPFLPHC